MRNKKTFLYIIILVCIISITGCQEKNIEATKNDNNDDIVTEDKVEEIIEEVKPVEQPIENQYKPFASVLDNIISNYGILNTSYNKESGLVYANLVDFQGDGNNELFLVYSPGELNGVFTTEIWDIKNGKTNQVYSEKYDGSGLVQDRTIKLTSDGTKTYLCYSSVYSTGREPEPYCNVAFTSNSYYTLENNELIELDEVTQRDESTLMGERRRIYVKGDNKTAIGKEEYDEVNSKYGLANAITIIYGNAGCPGVVFEKEEVTTNIIKTYNEITVKKNDDLVNNIDNVLLTEKINEAYDLFSCLYDSIGLDVFEEYNQLPEYFSSIKSTDKYLNANKREEKVKNIYDERADILNITREKHVQLNEIAKASNVEACPVMQGMFSAYNYSGVIDKEVIDDDTIKVKLLGSCGDSSQCNIDYATVSYDGDMIRVISLERINPVLKNQ